MLCHCMTVFGHAVLFDGMSVNEKTLRRRRLRCSGTKQIWTWNKKSTVLGFEDGACRLRFDEPALVS